MSKVLSDEDIHDIVNSLGIVKNNAELVLLKKYKASTEEGRNGVIKSMIERLDVLIRQVRDK